MQNLLAGQRVLITQAHDFMGPVFCEVFAEQGATVVASPDALSEPDAAEPDDAEPDRAEPETETDAEESSTD